MTMPADGNLDVKATTNNNDVYASRILVFVTVTAAVTVPDAPTSPSATGGGGVINVKWTTPSDGGSAITGYEIYRGLSSNPTTLLTTLGVTNSYHDTEVTNGTTYYYRVKAVNAIGSSAYSSSVSANPAGGTSTFRSFFKLRGNGAGTVKFFGGRILFK